MRWRKTRWRKTLLGVLLPMTLVGWLAGCSLETSDVSEAVAAASDQSGTGGDSRVGDGDSVGSIDVSSGMGESSNFQPNAGGPANQGEIESGIDGIITVPIDSADHVREEVDYPTSPPAGGKHLPLWLNCGYYEVSVLNELAVHSLEHGVVWVTFLPGAPPPEELAELRDRVDRSTHLLVSPYQDQETPFVLTAWGRQLPLDSITDPRFERFLDVYLKDGPSAPEPGAACDGAVGVPPDKPRAQRGG